MTLRIFALGVVVGMAAGCRAPCEDSALGCGGRDASLSDAAQWPEARPDVQRRDGMLDPLPSGVERLPDGGCRLTASIEHPPAEPMDCNVSLERRELPPTASPSTPCGPGRLLTARVAGAAGDQYLWLRDRRSIYTTDGAEVSLDSTPNSSTTFWYWGGEGAWITTNSRDYFTWMSSVDYEANRGVVAIARLSGSAFTGNLLFARALPHPPDYLLRSERDRYWINSNILALVAGEDFLAFRYGDLNTTQGLYILPLSGGDAVRYPVPNDVAIITMSASGSRLVFTPYFNLYLYDHRLRATRLLLGGDGLFRDEARIVGDEVVYTEFRGEPTDPPPDDVWLLDLRTNERRPLTRRSPPVETVRIEPTLQGDWLVWTDMRNAADPRHYNAHGTSIYGLHRPTNTEVPLVTGTWSAAAPVFVDGQLLYSCRPTQHEPVGLYLMPLPTIPSGPRDS